MTLSTLANPRLQADSLGYEVTGGNAQEHLSFHPSTLGGVMPPPCVGCRSMLWVSQYGIISQQVVTNMLRSVTVAGLTAGPGSTPLERLLLQGTYALIACSAVHRVRYRQYLRKWPFARVQPVEVELPEASPCSGRMCWRHALQTF